MAKIVESATRAFNKRGFDGASLRSIALDAGITPQLLLHHCKSKEELWKTVMLEISHRYQAVRLQNEPDDPALTATQRLHNWVRTLVEWTCQVPEMYRLWMLEGVNVGPRQAWFSETVLRPAYEELIALIERSQAEGGVHAGDPVRLRQAILVLSGIPFSNFAEYEYFTGRDAFTAQEIERTIEMINQLVFTDHEHPM